MYRPCFSLRESTWFKLICGASYNYLPAIRSLIIAYSLAGADCIDVAADPAIIAVALEAIALSENLKLDAFPHDLNKPLGKPWLMVSLNDGDDPHFRKAEFDPSRCPTDCLRPCEKICPASAIALTPKVEDSVGVIRDRCYGCGRCVPVCPAQNINTQFHSIPLDVLTSSILPRVDAVEIHTQVGREVAFQQLWRVLVPYVENLKLVSISCPDGDGLIIYLKKLIDIMHPVPHVLIWQTDGRSMSGDIGNGTTHGTIRLAEKVIAAKLPGYVQLAGGTNGYTVPKLRQLNLLQPNNQISGVAYGSYARSLLMPILENLDHLWDDSLYQGKEHMSHVHQAEPQSRLEEYPSLLWSSVHHAYTLVSQLKQKSTRFHEIHLRSWYNNTSFPSQPFTQVN